MTQTTSPQIGSTSHTYQISIKGKIALKDWDYWFEGFVLETVSPVETKLIGPIRDQAHLFAVLTKLRDLGISILSVTCLEK